MNISYYRKWSVSIIFLLGLIVFIFHTKTVNAETVKNITLKDGKIYRDYDITGDKKKDKLKIEMVEDSSFWYSALNVYINEKCVLSIDYGYEEDWSNCKLLRLKNGKIFLYIHLGGDNNDGPTNLYAYENGKLVKKVDLIEPIQEMGYHSEADVESVKGNKIIFKMCSMSYALASVDFWMQYKYKSGSMALMGKTYKIDGYYNNRMGEKGIGTLTTIDKIQLYKDKKAYKKLTKLKKGSCVKVTKCYIDDKRITFYLKDSNGKTGWLISPKSADNDNKTFDEIGYAG